MHLVPELFRQFFYDIECKLQKGVILWTFFYINCFSHSILIAREKYFMFLVFLDYHLRYIYAEIAEVMPRPLN